MVSVLSMLMDAVCITLHLYNPPWCYGDARDAPPRPGPPHAQRLRSNTCLSDAQETLDVHEKCETRSAECFARGAAISQVEVIGNA